MSMPPENFSEDSGEKADGKQALGVAAPSQNAKADKQVSYRTDNLRMCIKASRTKPRRT